MPKHPFLLMSAGLLLTSLGGIVRADDEPNVVLPSEPTVIPVNTSLPSKPSEVVDTLQVPRAVSLSVDPMATVVAQASPSAAKPSQRPAEAEPLPEPGTAVDNLGELERLRRQIALQQKQIDTLRQMTELLANRLKVTIPPRDKSSDVQILKEKTAELEDRSIQAAHRDKEVADAVDSLHDRVDSQWVRGPELPPTAKELFLPMQTVETPLSIYGSMVGDYAKPNGKNGQFGSPTFSPYFLLQLNKRVLLESTIDFSNTGVGVGVAHLDWFLTNNLTLLAGRYLTPIGFFNEQLNHEWINKLPDVPLMFRQVSPLTSTDGLQLRGGKYIAGSPFKLTYSGYLGNGFQTAAAPGKGLNGVADLNTLVGGPDEVNVRSYGGRLSIWNPLIGVTTGISGYHNGAYASNSRDGFNLWQYDFNYRYGNWDARFEYAQNNQQAGSFIGKNIDRRGLYAQLAYRNYASRSWIWQRSEMVFRYGYTNFHGVDRSQLDLTAYGSPLDAPINRNQYTFGVNYYFYTAMFVKFAYEINQELTGKSLNDNIFLAQGIWAF